MSDIVEDGWKTLNEAWKFSKRTVLSTPEMEVKVEEATSNEEWGPSSSQLTEIAAASFRYSDLPLIMGTLYRRMLDNGKNWRHAYKSLVVMEYLLKHGADDAIRSMRAHSLDIQQLTHFHYIDDHKDVGQAIRNKAKLVLELIHDEAKLREERDKAKKNRGKYQGYGSDTPYRGGGGGSYGRDYDDEYNRNPYESRSPYESRRQESPSPSTYRRKPQREELSDSESDDSDTEKRVTSTRGRPRAPSDEEDRKKPTGGAAPAPSKQLVNLFDDPPVTTTTPSPFFPPPPGGGSSSGGNIFDDFNIQSGPPSFAPFGPSPTPAGPPLGSAVPLQKPPATEEEWDAFKSFETPKDQKDIWYQHKSLFDLQHLNHADKKADQPKTEEKKPIGAMLAEKQKTKPGPTLGNPSTFAPFGPTPTPAVKPAPVPYVTPILPSTPSVGQPVYPAGAGFVGAPVVPTYPATGYPYAPVYGAATVPVQYPPQQAYAVPSYRPPTAGAK